MKKRTYLFVDTETTGLISRSDSDASVESDEPLVMELAFILTKQNREILTMESYLLKGFSLDISEKVESITGISRAMIEKDGVDAFSVLKRLINLIKLYNPIIVAHNVEFDLEVLQISIDKHNLNFSLDSLDRECTMLLGSHLEKFNGRYPRLQDLYYYLCDKQMTQSHRALSDAKVAMECFFELFEITDIVSLKKESKISGDIVFDNKRIQYAIESYIEDIKSTPQFFDQLSLAECSMDTFSNNVIVKANRYYQNDVGYAYSIPYDQVFIREAVHIPIADIIIRYVLKAFIQERAQYGESTVVLDQTMISSQIKIEQAKGRCTIVKIDVLDCFNSIQHDRLVREFTSLLNLDNNSLFSSLFKNCLGIVYKRENDEIVKKEIGVLIGSKPDEYFAEVFLELIAEQIRKHQMKVIRYSDEFIFSFESVEDARRTLPFVQTVFASYGLTINKSKTEVISQFSKMSVQNDQVVEFVAATLDSMGFKRTYEKFILLRDKLPVNSKGPINDANIVNETPSIDLDRSDLIANSDAKNLNVNTEVKSNKDSIFFLERMLSSIVSIGEWFEKYPKEVSAERFSFSIPSKCELDNSFIDNSLFSSKALLVLKQIIYRFPKSQYYSALAIEMVCYVAKNSVHIFGNEVSEISNTSTLACEQAHLLLIELLESNEIYEYQKYLCLRSLFFDSKTLSVSIDNYSVRRIFNYRIIHRENSGDLEEYSSFLPPLPFLDRIILECDKLKDTKHIPLRSFIQAVGSAQKDTLRRDR